MTHPLRRAVIDTAAIRHNVRTVRAATGVPVIAVVKADGYGHGAVRAARAAIAGGARMLGVADIAEALALRRAGIDAPIIAWLHGARASFDEAVAAGITLGISTRDQLDVAAATAGRTVVHLKVDSGLSRNGVPLSAWSEVVARAAALASTDAIEIEGVFTHLSGTSDADDIRQARVFDDALAVADHAGIRPNIRHLAASRAAFSLPKLRYDAVRCGIAIYGQPADERMPSPAALGLWPAMTLESEVVAVKRVPRGTGVSYGYTHRVAADTTLALVPLGYADGIPRQASGRAEVSIRGERHPVVGRIAMDQFVVDVGATEVSPGDPVTVFGASPTADEWAGWSDTIAYDIVTRIGSRVVRAERGGS